jgi:ribosomal-protein-alanine N-acetyltransferase
MIEHWDRHGFGPWAVIHKDDGLLIGHCGLRYWPQTTDVEVLYALDRRYWGQGLATEGAVASLRYGFETLQLRRIIAAAFTGNAGSRRVLDKIGMRFEGTFTFAGREAARYAITRREHRPGTEPYQILP